MEVSISVDIVLGKKESIISLILLDQFYKQPNSYWNLVKQKNAFFVFVTSTRKRDQ